MHLANSPVEISKNFLLKEITEANGHNRIAHKESFEKN